MDALQSPVNMLVQLYITATHQCCTIKNGKTKVFDQYVFLTETNKCYDIADTDSSKVKKAKASSYIAQYPILRTVQSALHFTSLTDLFTQTPSQLLWEASSHMLQLMREGCSYTYPSLSIARYSFIKLKELEQCRVKKTCPRF